MENVNMGMGPVPGYGQAYGPQSGYAQQPGYTPPPPPAGYGPQPGYGAQPAYMPPAYPAPAMNGAYGAAPYEAPAAPRDEKARLATTGLVLGIIGLVAALVPICGLPLSIGGIVFSLLGRGSASRRTMATVGLVLSIIAIGLTIANAALGAYLATHTGTHAAAR